jgi:O-antigen/teichoic acid export membrane protein
MTVVPDLQSQEGNYMKNKMLKNTAWYFGGTIASAILGFINTPLLTRILEPKVYAQYGMLITFTTVLATFIYLGQDEAFMRFFERRKEGYKEYFWRCIRIPLFLCFVVMLLLLEPSHSLLNWVFESELPLFTCILIGVYVVAIVIQRFLMLTARMEERAANYALSNIVTKGGFIVATTAIYYLTKVLPFDEIIICLLFGVVIALFINLMVVTRISHSANPEGEEVSSKELLKFGLPFAFSTTLFFTVPLIEKLIIRTQTSWETLAIYTAAAIFVTVMNLVKTTVNSIWVPYVYKNYQNEEKFKNIFYNVGICLIAFCLVVIAGTILTRRWLVLMFDSKYYDAMLIAPAMVCGACFDLLSCIYSIGINITKKTKYHIIIPVVQLGVSTIVLFALLPSIGLRATGISYLLSIGISRMVQMTIALKNYDTGKQNTKMYILFFGGIVAALLAVFIRSFIFDVLCCIILIAVISATSHRELLTMLKWIIDDRKLSKNEV